jgi:uncharacterized repeat protein (TIGR01451 family)
LLLDTCHSINSQQEDHNMNIVRTKRSRFGTARRELRLILAGAAFFLGVIACQIVCGDEEHVHQEPEGSQPVKVQSPVEEPQRIQLDNRPVLELLGGEAGFGNGPAIGSGIAEIVIGASSSPAASPSTIESLPALKPQAADTMMQPVQLESIPTRIPSQFKTADKIPTTGGLIRVTEQQTSYDQDEVQVGMLSFGLRRKGNFVPVETIPDSLCVGETYDPTRSFNPWHPDPRKDELVFNGGDQGKRATVDSSWNVYNLNPEDTIGHFDTLDGRRLVTPSNRVAIYAPRFAAVRKLDGLVNSETSVKLGSMDEKTAIKVSDGQDFSATTKQNLSLERYQGIKRASGFLDTNRGVTSDNVIQLFGARNTFEAFENLALFRIGRHQNSEGARLGLGMQSANVWQDNVGLQVSVKGAQPVIVNDIYKVQQIVRIDSDDKHAVLRVCKVASKLSAKAGEQVDFTIRFDNLTGRPIGNVTIIDNLASRLDYVADSAECSLKANFSSERNEVGSLVLRWEIIDPMPANSGGIIRFRCRVQ